MRKLPPQLVAGILNAAMFAQGAFAQGKPGFEQIPEDIIKMARSQLGVSELPLYSDRGDRVDQYDIFAQNKLGTPWCAAFISWVMGQVDQQHGHTLALHELEGLPQPPDFEKKAKELGVLKDPKTYSPRPSDILIFKWEFNGHFHAEMVTGPATKDHLIPTIGGNTMYANVGESAYKVFPDGGIGYAYKKTK